MTDTTRTIDEMARDAVAQCVAEFEAAHRPPALTLEQQAIQRLEAATFRERISEEALLHGVRPAAVRHVLRDAETVFALKDNAIIPKDGQTDPSDPLSPLTPRVWLEQLAQTEPFLFAPDERSH